VTVLLIPFLVTRALSGLLFGMGARDPLTFVAVPAALLLVSLAGCWISAQRGDARRPGDRAARRELNRHDDRH
jgi:hypothetical protein